MRVVIFSASIPGAPILVTVNSAFVAEPRQDCT